MRGYRNALRYYVRPVVNIESIRYARSVVRAGDTEGLAKLRGDIGQLAQFARVAALLHEHNALEWLDGADTYGTRVRAAAGD